MRKTKKLEIRNEKLEMNGYLAAFLISHLSFVI